MLNFSHSIQLSFAARRSDYIPAVEGSRNGPDLFAAITCKKKNTKFDPFGLSAQGLRIN